mmetsp:Transcript_92956/g.300462  ORF Transcript_92956/g.300462 Transcript_92956/m.300462 type:complete len:109 (-) Transcript_92956:104-430(-)
MQPERPRRATRAAPRELTASTTFNNTMTCYPRARFEVAFAPNKFEASPKHVQVLERTTHFAGGALLSRSAVSEVLRAIISERPSHVGSLLNLITGGRRTGHDDHGHGS